MPRLWVDVVDLLEELRARGKLYIGVHELARMLGVPRTTAGRILAEMERMGLVERWSKRFYRIKEQR